MACRSRWASHHPSWSSVLCPFRFFTCSGLASCTLTASSNTLNTGFQYDPVLSITTSVTPSCFSQARNRSSSATVAPYLRRSARGSPVNGPTSTHTARNLFPTSMPAHRSTAAGIIVVSLPRRRTVNVSIDIFFRGSTSPFGGSSRSLGQFRLRVLLRSITQSGRLLRALFQVIPSSIFISGGGLHARPWMFRFVAGGQGVLLVLQVASFGPVGGYRL